MARQNILLILTDQQQAQALGCVNPSFSTPNLDRLAAEGVRFSNAIAASGQCTPSRASLMTGLYPHQVGVLRIGHQLDPALDSVGKVFRRNGYETAYFGKWHLYTPLEAHGYDITQWRNDGVDPGGPWHGAERSETAADAGPIAMTLNYLEDYDGDKPFFLITSWNTPHPPFEFVEPFTERFPRDEMPVPDSFYKDDLSTKPKWQQERASNGESLLTEDIVRRDGQAYRTMVAHLDWNVGRILDVLERKGLAERTSIMFTTDHGDMQGAHRLRLKGVIPYKELYNVPLIMRTPGRESMRKVIEDLVVNTAVPGTLMELAGINIPEQFEGGSLVPLLGRTERPEDEMVFFEHYQAYWGFYPFRGVQTREWKYVFYYEHGVEEMYDLVDDPDENINVADKPSAAAAKGRLRQAVDEWWNSTPSREPLLDPKETWGSGGPK